MGDEGFDSVGDGLDEKRRSTYTPPPLGAPFPERLGELSDEDIQRARQASEKVSNASAESAVSEPDPESTTYRSAPAESSPALPPGPQIPPAPVRLSLPDSDILARFEDDENASTEEMMVILEAQVSLRAEDDARFEAWEETVRATLPSDEADRLVAASRRSFDGLPPLPEPEPEVPVEPEAVSEESLGHGALSAEGSNEDSAEHPEAPALVTAGVSVGTDTLAIQQSGLDGAAEVAAAPAVPADRWFSFDRVGAEPTPADKQTAGLLSVFWTWWSTAVPLGGMMLGAWLIAAGNSVIAALGAALVGVAIGVLPIVVGTVVGSRSGLPALIASREIFGLVGNIVPSALIVVIRVAVTAFFIWAAVWVAGGVLINAGLWPDLVVSPEIILAAVALVVVGAIVMVGRRFVSLLLWLSGVLSVLAAAAIVFLTAPAASAASLPFMFFVPEDFVAGASFVVAVLFVLWAHTGSDVARFSHPSRAGKTGGLVAVAAVIPPLVFIGWGIVVAGADARFRSGLLVDPLSRLLDGLPSWYPAPAIVLFAVPLLGLAALAAHSSSYAMMSVGLRLSRFAAATIVILIVAATVAAVVLTIGSPAPYLVDVVRIAGVIVAAWVGVFLGHAATRKSSWSPGGALGATGTVPAIRVGPVAGFVVAIAAGWGFTQTAIPGTQWLGYFNGLLIEVGVIDFGAWQGGVIVSLLVALVVSGIAGLVAGRGSATAHVGDAA
jgi:nucleobase:cation symporter-1, NCS1 family